MQPKTAIETLRAHLAEFPYRVAVFPNDIPELGGAVLEVHAFDVPDAELVRVQRELNGLLVKLRLEPMAIGMAFHEGESEVAAAGVPADATWITPRSRPARA